MSISNEEDRLVEYEGPDICGRAFGLGCALAFLAVALLVGWLIVRF